MPHNDDPCLEGNSYEIKNYVLLGQKKKPKPSKTKKHILPGHKKKSKQSETRKHIFKNDKKRSIQIFYQNANSLRRKTHEFYLNILNEDYEIIVITESWLCDDINDSELFDDRYNVFRQDRRKANSRETRGGGLIFAAKKEINVTPITQMENSCTEPLETMWLRCNLFGQDLICCICYFQPSVKLETMKKFVDRACTQNDFFNCRILFLGDFNIPEFENSNLSDTQRLTHMNRLVNMYNLESLNNIKNHKSRTLDLCLTNFAQYNISRNKHAKINLEKGQGLVKPVKDHPPLLINIEIQSNQNSSASNDSINVTKKVYNFKQADYTALGLDLDSVNWQEVLNTYDNTDCNKKLDTFYCTLKGLLDKHVPCFDKPRKKIKFPVWWTYETKKMFKKKERLRKVQQRSQQQQNKYFQLRKLCKKQIKSDHKKYIDNISNSLKQDSTLFWKYIKNKKKLTKKQTLKYQGQVLNKSQTIADAFAKHFSSAYNSSTANNPLISTEPVTNFYIHIGQITEHELMCAIKSIPEKKAPGTDGLPPLLYKMCAEQLKIPLTLIFNASLNESRFPEKLKESVITPIPKKGSSVDIENYRPISTLNSLAKIYENVLYEKISSFIFSSITPHQHGFVKGRSTLTNLAEFTHYTSKVVSLKRQVDVIYTDVMKCFDSIYHSAINHKLKLVGFSPPLTQLIDSYLRNRKNYVSYEECTSKPFTPPSGVAQGSKLSSLLFILTFDDVHKNIKHSQFQLYADDLKIYKEIISINDCLLLQEDIDRVQKWLKAVGLSFHPDKSYKMTYTNTKNIVKHNYTINNITTQEVDTYKDLGVTLTRNITWGAHIQKVTEKAYQKLGLIIRYCKPINDIDAILTLYRSLVRSTIEYCSVIWSPKTKKDRKQLEDIQACFVRYLFQKLNGFYPSYPHNISYKTLIENIPLPSIEERLSKNQFGFIEKIIKYKIDSPYILKNIDFRIPNPRLRIDTSRLFELPRYKHDLLFRSPLLSALKVYNDILDKPDIFL